MLTYCPSEVLFPESIVPQKQLPTAIQLKCTVHNISYWLMEGRDY